MHEVARNMVIGSKLFIADFWALSNIAFALTGLFSPHRRRVQWPPRPGSGQAAEPESWYIITIMTIISDPRLRLCITTDPIRSNPKTSDHIKYNLWCILSFSLQVFSLQIGYTPIIINYQYQLTILNNVKSRDPIGSKNYWLNLIYQNTKNKYLSYIFWNKAESFI